MRSPWRAAVVGTEKDGTVPTLPSFEELAGLKEEEMTIIVQADFREWQRKHTARGVKQGIEQERRRSVAMVRGQAAIKFGAQTADRLAEILGANPTAERMDEVGVAIMECDSGAELLARCSEAGA